VQTTLLYTLNDFILKSILIFVLF